MLVPVKNIFKKVRQIYTGIDKQVSAQATRMKATCTKGCAGCCYQLVSTSFIEALLIADFLLRNRTPEELKEVTQKLTAATARYRFSQNRTTLFLEKEPCPFLITGEAPFTGTCSIYAARPLTCRMHYVVSDPKLCEPTQSYLCDIIDVRDATNQAVKIISGGSDVFASYGPLEPLVLHALEVSQQEKAVPSLLELEYWRRRIMSMINHDRAAQEEQGIKNKYI